MKSILVIVIILAIAAAIVARGCRGIRVRGGRSVSSQLDGAFLHKEL
jgi:hypothetical protein